MWSIHPVSSFPSNSFHVQAHSLYLFLILFSLLALCPHMTFGTLPPNLKMKSLEFQGDFDETTFCPPLLFHQWIPIELADCINMLIFWTPLNPQVNRSCEIRQLSSLVGSLNSPTTTQIGIRMKNLIDRSTFWCLLSHRKISIQFSKDESV